MATPAKFTLIVPVYGEFDFAFKCLDSLVRHTTDYRCIVIDDCSPGWTDAVRAEIERIVPRERLHFERFDPNRGLTAAWNRGLELARDFGCPYAALVNSDTLFTPGWLVRTVAALDQVDLVGPMSNAPGEHEQQQIQRLLRDYRPDDSPEALADLSWRLRDKFSGQIRPGVVNGFWFAAKTKTWWNNAFDATHVFDPAKRLVGNESEFQKRFRGKIGAAADVFIFHYRSVSRGLENVDPTYNIGAFRPAAATGEKISASAPPTVSGQGGAESRPLHVCFVCDEFPPAPHGGTGSSYRDLAHGLAAAGHRVTVVGVYPRAVLHKLPPDPQSPNLRIVRRPSFPAWFGWKFRMLADRWRLKRWLARTHRRRPFDVIECSDYGGWLPFGGPRGVTTITRLRGSNLFFDHELNRSGNAFEHGLERKSLRHAAVLAAVSQYAARRTLDLCGQPSRPVTVIPNAVDTGLFSPAEKSAVEPGLIVFVNSLNPKKGIGQLVDAMNVVCAKHPSARLVAVGQDTQPAEGGLSYVERLRGRIRPEFRARVEFIGRQDRAGVLGWLRRAHICCLPSHMETFGIAAVEAMSVGKPVIYSRTGPGPEVVEDGVSGLLCDPCDPADIATKINTILESPSLAETLSRNARARALACFEKQKWVQANVEFFRQVGAGRLKS
ncbi:MAG: glycosyltransferase [Verrucomicrobia bacterium]|nr:glycosyltransferase [Verrucomicrobiota bacterium]